MPPTETQPYGRAPPLTQAERDEIPYEQPNGPAPPGIHDPKNGPRPVVYKQPPCASVSPKTGQVPTIPDASTVAQWKDGGTVRAHVASKNTELHIWPARKYPTAEQIEWMNTAMVGHINQQYNLTKAYS